ncbi:flagellar motor protein MotB [Bacillus piscicola]|uniref:flagellar motor protein MotB n=1 Tax=Bacillus piscicola TaxID=1632684 RepID=UPI001F08A7ED|nr:flagellar motor protein MotB [Bacillus piscicola]
MRKQKQHKEEHIQESWLLPYADMLTLLLALFIVLFAMSEIDAEKYEELATVLKGELSGSNGFLEQNQSLQQLPHRTEESATDDANKQELDELKNLQQNINTYIEKNSLSDVLETRLTGEGLMIAILNDVFFDSGSAVVKEEGKTIAKEMATFLNTDPPRQIIVSGHTDDKPIHTPEFTSNWDLSAMRAVNFMRLLLENDGLEPGRFSAKGYGEHQPNAPNNSKENRAKNRRVEVLILPNYVETTGKTDRGLSDS